MSRSLRAVFMAGIIIILAACTDAGTSPSASVAESEAPSTESEAGEPVGGGHRLRSRGPRDEDGGDADHRHRQSRLPAVLQRAG